MGRGAWQAAVHGVSKSQTRLSDFAFTFHFHALEKEMATHSSVLAWRIPGTAEPGGLLSTGLHRVRHDWSDLAAAADWCRSNNNKKNIPLHSCNTVSRHTAFQQKQAVPVTSRSPFRRCDNACGFQHIAISKHPLLKGLHCFLINFILKGWC